MKMSTQQLSLRVADAPAVCKTCRALAVLASSLLLLLPPMPPQRRSSCGLLTLTAHPQPGTFILIHIHVTAQPRRRAASRRRRSR